MHIIEYKESEITYLGNVVRNQIIAMKQIAVTFEYWDSTQFNPVLEKMIDVGKKLLNVNGHGVIFYKKELLVLLEILYGEMDKIKCAESLIIQVLVESPLMEISHDNFNKLHTMMTDIGALINNDKIIIKQAK